MNKTPRSATFRNNIVKAFSYKCTLTGMDEIQCEAAHIVPRGRSDTEPNGMLLSRELHWLYDRYVWSAIPSTRRICPRRENFVSYDIEISDKYVDKKLTINDHRFKRLEVKAWSHKFIEQAYIDFRKENYPEEFREDETPEEEKVMCEFCNDPFSKRGIKKHQNTCPKRKVRSD